MRKYLWSMIVCLLLSSTMFTVAYGENNPGKPAKPAVQLTEQQKTELANLHKDILEKKKEMILKYVEFGVIPEEKGQMIISHFEKHYEMLEQNGFIFRMPPNHHKAQMPNKP
ncbi:YckD family protein [Bacillus sp. 1NLA3E]|uniref:YckD family protein n=1 Tax=Bacillus sp. 1NLA3E TaxID=666686 RepID=UPI000247EF8D|nr:YckD family protein [Bacillus sp. 1NLA3E]AGK56117.1 sporulation protein YckD [Bacillus sp. 1NLA3E]